VSGPAKLVLFGDLSWGGQLAPPRVAPVRSRAAVHGVQGQATFLHNVKSVFVASLTLNRLAA